MSTSNGGEAQMSQWQHQVKESLTRREWEVVRLVARGLTNPDIATATFRGKATIKTYVQRAIKKLDPLAAQAGVLSMNRVGLAVVCVQAGQAVKTPYPRQWAVALDQRLSSSDRIIVSMAADVETDQELVQRLTRQGMSGQLSLFQRKIAPFLAYANVERLDCKGVVELFVRAGTEVNPAMYRRWRSSVDASVSRRERDVLKWLVKGLESKEIAAKLDLSPLTIKAHLARVAARLGPYAAMVGVERPSSRTGLAVITVLAGLDKAPS